MRAYNSFIVVLGTAFAAVTVLLAALNVQTLDIYFTAYTVVLLGQTAFYLYFSPRARRALGLIGAVAAAGFLVMVALKAIELMMGSQAL